MRILSLHPCTTEIVFALGAGNLLVGRTDKCIYPEAANNVPSIGDITTITADAIAIFEPDIVLIGHNQDKIKEISGNISVVQFVPQSTEELIAEISSLGEKFGKEVEAQLIMHDIQFVCDTIKNKSARFFRTRVYLEQERILAPPAFIDELIKVAGGEPSRFSSNPQIIIAATEHEDYIQTIAQRRGWEQVQAIRHERIFHIDEQLLQPTPRMTTGLKQLAKILHGIEINQQ